jgi:hypothetical protein
MVTSDLPFEEWTSVLGSERLTGALLDRFTHHVHNPSLDGESYRPAPPVDQGSVSRRRRRRKSPGITARSCRDSHRRSQSQTRPGPDRSPARSSAAMPPWLVLLRC